MKNERLEGGIRMENKVRLWSEMGLGMVGRALRWGGHSEDVEKWRGIPTQKTEDDSDNWTGDLRTTSVGHFQQM